LKNVSALFDTEQLSVFNNILPLTFLMKLPI